jgi:VanZ family protein
MLPLRHRRLWIALSAVLLAAVVFASLQPNLGPRVPANVDKIEHLVAYVALAVWFTGLVVRDRYWTVAVGLLAFGAAIEVLQGLMNIGRSAEWLDMLANTLGIGVGFVIATWVTGGWSRRFESWLSST